MSPLKGKILPYRMGQARCNIQNRCERRMGIRLNKLRYQLRNLLAGLLLLGFVLANAHAEGPSHGMWTQSLFFRGFNPTTGSKLRMTDIVQLSKDAKSNSIRDLYIFAGPFNADGSIPEYAFSQTARSTIKRLRELAPQVRVLPWLGGLQDKTVFLNNSAWRARAIDDTIRLTQFLGVAGAHLDFEYILPSSTFVIQTEHIPAERSPMNMYHPSMRDFFRELKQKAPSLFISTVFPSSAPEVSPWKINPTRRELEEVAPLTNQISLLFYDTSIKSQELFEQGMRHQLEDIVAVRKASPSTEMNVAFGTFINYEALHPYRDLSIENLPNSFATLKRALHGLAAGNPLSGISIFCEWETEAAEWDQFREGSALIAPFAIADK